MGLKSMGELVPLNFGAQSNPAKYGQDGSALLINAQVKDLGGEGKTRFGIYAHSGLKSFATLTNGGATRGMEEVDEYLYTVSGRLLFRVSENGTATVVGGIPSDGFVYMAGNAKSPDKQLAIVTDGLKFIVEGGSLHKIEDPDLPPAIDVGFLNGMLLFFMSDGRFFWSEINEGTDIDALSFATAEGNPDGIVRGIIRRSEIWILGPKSVEVWGSTQDADDPFQRLPGAFIERGCSSGASALKIDEQIYWLDDNGSVVKAEGYTPQTISNHAVEEDIRKISDKSTISAWSYSEGQSRYYVLTCAAWTWCYDVNLGIWGKKQSSGLDRYRVQSSARFKSRNIVGDYQSGTLYELDSDTYSEAGSDFIWSLQSPIIHSFPQRIRYNSIFLDMLSGVGLEPSNADYLSTPELMLNLSQDGGKTFGPAFYTPLGQMSESQYIRINNLGVYRNMTARLSVSASVARGFLGAKADITRLRT